MSSTLHSLPVTYKVQSRESLIFPTVPLLNNKDYWLISLQTQSTHKTIHRKRLDSGMTLWSYEVGKQLWIFYSGKRHPIPSIPPSFINIPVKVLKDLSLILQNPPSTDWSSKLPNFGPSLSQIIRNLLQINLLQPSFVYRILTLHQQNRTNSICGVL